MRVEEKPRCWWCTTACSVPGSVPIRTWPLT